MTLTRVDFIPGKRTNGRNSLQMLLTEFAESDMKFAKVDFKHDEYVSAKSCLSALAKAIWRKKYPLKAIMRAGDVYLIKL